MSPEQIIEKIRKSRKAHLLYRLDGEVKATPARTPAAESMSRHADVIGVYSLRAVPAMIAEDLSA